MSEAQHTPGPWRADSTNVSERYRYVLGGRRLICRITKGDGESEANARLIAAAPELLEALIAAEQAFVEHGIPLACHASLFQIRAAIAKATGQPA